MVPSIQLCTWLFSLHHLVWMTTCEQGSLSEVEGLSQAE